ncbi:hypothetical protein IM697_02605 [Streptomyces ferrugineus]|uniref:Transposase IS4-like domain-containing protein n=1 Tax=Streptomyces ferrugineus TaxID=1413221 RepID=A0A7M2T0C1_9ACTN|nr:hypothetical protein [Streptomyces ferrugineus]QOV41599.1 hypothetical protein IM697_02605 [Streptomyces ferrugineus]
MLLLADRGFPSFALWEKAAATGAGPGEAGALREQRAKRTIDVRVIEYTITRTDEHGGTASELFCLITTLRALQAAPAAELGELYARRWSIERIRALDSTLNCGTQVLEREGFLLPRVTGRRTGVPRVARRPPCW